MRQLCYTVLLCLTGITSFGQAYVPPSPDALGLAKFANTPVNYYTGTPSISVPLGQIAGKELSVPIGLSYNATGFKVQEGAGSVGLGWSLEAGGVITRMVRGLPDEMTGGFCGSHTGNQPQYPSSQYYENVRNGTWDGEPDIFFFSFLGRSGKFVLDAYGQAFTMPFQDIVIKPGICGSSSEWLIIDENGVKYKFGTNSSSKETTTSRVASQPLNQARSYVSSWYLTEIRNANDTDVVTLSYTPSYNSYASYYFEKMEDGTPCNQQVNQVKDLSTIISVTTKHPNIITTSLGYAILGWTSGRQDVASNGGVFLSSVAIYNYQNQLINKNRLEYGYFQADNCSGAGCMRLRLDRIYDMAPDPIVSFTYNTTTNLPPVGSPNFDRWGYYNNNTVNSWLPATSYEIDLFNTVSWTGASRDSDATKALANLLSRVDVRGGGYTLYNFEAHQAYDNLFAQANIVVGGARIGSIQTFDGNGGSITRTFSYLKDNSTQSSGQAFYMPMKFVIKIDNDTYKRFSHSLTSGFDINGTHIGYSKVEESISGMGKTKYYFTNFDTNPDGGNLFDLFAPVTIPSTSKDWERGNLLFQKVEDNAGNLLQVQSNLYANNLSDKRSIKAWKVVDKTYECSSYVDYLSGSYNLISRPITLTQSKTETYDPANSSKKMVQITDYEYDPVTYQMVKSLSYDEKRPTTKYVSQSKFVTNNDYYYTVDCDQQSQLCIVACDSQSDPQTRAQCYIDCQNQYSTCTSGSSSIAAPSKAIIELKERHQISAPVETITMLQNGASTKILGSSLNVFNIEGTSSNLINVKESYQNPEAIDDAAYVKSKILSNGDFQKDGHYRKVKNLDSYHQTNGNLLQETSFAGIQTSYNWSSDNKLVTGTTTTAGGLTRSVSMITKPLVGPLSKTDQNGRNSYQEYDVYNRPFLTKDHDGNILGKTRYHYKNETPGFIIANSVNRWHATVNETIYYSVTDIAASIGGTPQFAWDLGGGNVIENSTTATFTYTTAGKVLVTVSCLSPEYGPVTRGVFMQVHNPPSITLSKVAPTDPCGTWVITAAIANGCPSSTYVWEVTDSQGNALPVVSDGNRLDFVPPTVGSFSVYCTFTDICGNEVTGSISVTRNSGSCL